MQKLVFLLLLCVSLFSPAIGQKNYTYESIPNDPIKARIYTLDNGLKVYMSVNKEEPKIKFTIATKAGSKLDPHETTGLAHYFEHLMFKGSSHFGTNHYEAEKPLLDQIEHLFEIYRKTKDDGERAVLYRQIDSISQIASQYAIPNEYTKLMAILGSTGTNAGTWVDFTNYYENIPSNQLENLLIIQSDRFQHPVLRLFHTELETIYEEKNMTLTQDRRKANTALMEALFPNHPYGNQTTIGTQEDLRNPSITNVKNFFNRYYVPNNMAIIMAGDFNPDETIILIDKYFGVMKKKELPPFVFTPEKPITAPVVKEVVGNEAENITIAWRFDNPRSKETAFLTLMDMILTNGNAGLVDLNVNQKQKVLTAGSYPQFLYDYSYLGMYGSPKEGQTLDQVKDILLEQVALLKKGDFPDWLLEACINDMRLRQMKSFEKNAGRENAMAESFYLDIPWTEKVHQLDDLSKITKKQIVDFANEHLKNNYVVIYKRQGKPDEVDKIQKPQITSIQINRGEKSEFLKKIEERKVAPIAPVFIDFKKDINTVKAKNDILVYYTQNKENELFELAYTFDMGRFHDKELPVAISYLEYLGTGKLSPEQIKEEFYKLGCSYKVVTSNDKSAIVLSGLTQNIEPAMELLEEVLNNAQPNQEALHNMVDDLLKKRKDAKSNQSSVFTYLMQYGIFGEDSPMSYMLNEKELKALSSESLINKIKTLNKYKQYVIYYGSLSSKEIVGCINKHHRVSNVLQNIPAEKKFMEKLPVKDQVYVVNFDTRQSMIGSVAFGNKYEKTILPTVRLYNTYFGGGMNAIVFQEMREARALAYTANSYYITPNTLDRLAYNRTYIATGNEKLEKAIDAFNELLNNMPENDASFNIAKEACMNSLRTSRITKSDIVGTYLYMKKMGWDSDNRRVEFDQIPTLSFKDIEKFQKEYVSKKARTYVIVGDVKELDMNYLEKIGKVNILTLEEVFGY